jgi:hypothetical protein
VPVGYGHALSTSLPCFSRGIPPSETRGASSRRCLGGGTEKISLGRVIFLGNRYPEDGEAKAEHASAGRRSPSQLAVPAGRRGVRKGV